MTKKGRECFSPKKQKYGTTKSGYLFSIVVLRKLNNICFFQHLTWTSCVLFMKKKRKTKNCIIPQVALFYQIVIFVLERSEKKEISKCLW